MSHPDVISTIWDDPRNVETLKAMWSDGKSATQIAVTLHTTRNSVIGKVHRLKLQKRDNTIRSKPSRTVNGREGHRGKSGGAGQSKANVIVHRVEGRLKAERARQEGKLSHRGEQPFRAPGRVDVDDDGGVDVSHLIAFADRKIGRECAWIPGDPLNGAMCCGKPVKPGSEWCEEHHARVYTKQGQSNA